MSKFKKIGSLFITFVLILSSIFINGNVFSASALQNSYVIISDEALDVSSSEYTGTFLLNNTASINNTKLNSDSYKMDYIKTFDKKIAANISESKINDDKMNTHIQYLVGDTKLFWVHNLANNTDSKITATLISSGTKCDV